MFQIGDKVKLSYISDCNKYNGKTGTITWLHDYNYYPNGDYSVIETRTQGTITYDDGGELMIPNMYRKGSGVVSAVIKVN
jgi:hypothetical protein